MGSDGSVKVIASIYEKKVQKNMDDYCGSATVIHIGSADGSEGPPIFFCAAKREEQTIKGNTKAKIERPCN